MIKYFRFSWHEVLFEMSYTNVLMLLATIPDYRSRKDDDEEAFFDDLETEEDFNKFFNMN